MRIFFISFLSILYSAAFAQPGISSFSPTSGPVGTTVTITGTGFSSTPANNIVYFGAVRGSVSVSTATSITINVPAGASYKPIAVTSFGLTGYSRKPFTVIFPGGDILTASSFAQSQDVTTEAYTPVHVSSMDLDTDGKPDLVATTFNSHNGTGSFGYTTVRKNNSTAGNLSFGNLQNFPNTGLGYYHDYADIDGDGRQDIVVPNTESNDPAKLVVFQNTSTNGSISFAPALGFLTNGGYGLTVADFDGDGLPDAATTNNSLSGKVSVHRNTSFGGIISFAPFQNFTTGGDPRAVATGLINNDNKPDLIVANQVGGTISVFINNSTPGNIAFFARQDFASTPGSACQQLAVGDFDGDDKADIAVANNNFNVVGTISVFRNQSTSTAAFATRLDLPTSMNWMPFHVDISDINGDGKPDISASGQGTPTVSVFRNTSTTGAISFAGKADFNSVGPARSVIAMDLDGDSKPELIANAVLNSSTPVNVFAVFRNVVDKPNISSFTPADACAGTTITITGTNFSGITSVSFGGVAATSFQVQSPTTITAVVGAGGTGAIAVTSVLGTGTIAGFTHAGICVIPPVIYSFHPLAATAGSPVTISGENFHPVMTENIVYFGAVKASVVSGTGTSLSVIVPAGATYTPITVTSNNLTCYSPKPFTLLFSEGENCEPFSANSFAPKRDFSTGSGPYFTTLADLDNNNRADLLTANFASNNFSSLKNTGVINTNVFDTKADLASGTQPLGIAYGDLDGDGKVDVALANYASNTVSVFRNTTTGSIISFASKMDFTTNANPRNLVIHDINFDGKPDILVTCYGAGSFSVLRNTGSGVGVISMAGHVAFGTGNNPVGISVLDMDGDNKPDVAVANLQSNSISVLKNTSTSGSSVSFNSKIDFPAGTQPISVFVTDLDGDDKPELISANYGAASVSILRNTTTGGVLSFDGKVDYSTGSGPFSVTVADLNADGKPDIATANVFEANVSVLRNNSLVGSLNFAAKTDYQTGANPRSITAGDTNGDGKTDLVIANSGDNSVSVLQNMYATTAGQICSNGSIAFTSGINGTAYQWQVNNGSGFVNISDNANYAGTNTSTLLITTLPSEWNGFEYRSIVDGANGISHSIKVTSKWTGAVDVNWENPGNWSCQQVPDANTDVIISCGKSVEVNVNTSCRSLSLKQGANILLKLGIQLNITH